jgi:hypothetical protein
MHGDGWFWHARLKYLILHLSLIEPCELVGAMSRNVQIQVVSLLSITMEGNSRRNCAQCIVN